MKGKYSRQKSPSSMASLPHAENVKVLNKLLDSVLPGSIKLDLTKKRQQKSRVSKVQLINTNLKKRIDIKERDNAKFKKKIRKLNTHKIKTQKEIDEKLMTQAKLQNLHEHKNNGTLTKKEKTYLNKIIQKNVKSVKSWEYEDPDEILRLQNDVLENTRNLNMHIKSKLRKKKKKEFNETITEKSQDHRYPGLTPGLAPVDWSDEQESSGSDLENFN